MDLAKPSNFGVLDDIPRTRLDVHLLAGPELKTQISPPCFPWPWSQMLVGSCSLAWHESVATRSNPAVIEFLGHRTWPSSPTCKISEITRALCLSLATTRSLIHCWAMNLLVHRSDILPFSHLDIRSLASLLLSPPFPPVDPVLQRWVDISPIHAGTGIHAIHPQFVDAPLSWAHFFLPTNQTEFILFYARPKEITLDPKLPLKKKEAAAKSSPSKKWREHGQKKVLTRSESQRRNSIVEPRSPSLNAPSL
ncbi:uncharacterized protein RSE6_07882 [Rhynchosporium secalis]|uniref:Uncharacterized protein n=1 Tax=Rhynchosporium secalis TaxID=38038 RepID=A0A1E1ME64_RHYSE|nr:uncharacterized protein RSE6_07882 [Rhynchosporium secalis]